MGRAALVTDVSTACTSASPPSPAMDSGPWFVWAWLADSTGTRGTTGTASAGTTTGTHGTASPSPVAWEGNDITISSSRREPEPLSLPLPLPTTKINSEPVSSCALSSSLDSSGSRTQSTLHSFHSNFLVLDTEQHWKAQPYCPTPSSTASNTNLSNNNNLNDPTYAEDTSSSIPAPDSFLLCSPSTLSFDANIEDHSWGTKQRPNSPKMPGSILPAAEEPYFQNSTYSAANISANTSQWRPHTSLSCQSARSASPLFTRWGRRHHQQRVDMQEFNDPGSSTDRKSTSSSRNPKRCLQHGDHGSNDNNDASHKHTYNFSTSTGSSSKRHSQSGLPPPLTREEFEALPLAIQRKVRAAPFVCHI